MKVVNSVDEYIKNAPEDIQAKLKQMRDLIKSVAPEAEEKISYGMPYYGYKQSLPSKAGKRRLAYFAYFKHHIGLYLTPPIIEEHKEELSGYGTAKATVRFPLDKDLPIALIKKLVKARVKLNEEL